MCVKLRNMIILPLLLCFVLHTEGKIFNLNDTEYSRMPPLYVMEDYHNCMLRPGGTYCIVDLELFEDHETALMKLIRDYSDVATKHFNHTILHRGVCITDTCKQFINQRNLSNPEDVTAILEACINNTIWKQYKIQARVATLKECQKEADTVTYDKSDYVVVGLVLIIITLNLIGTLYDVFKQSDTKGNRYLMAFSLLRNWGKLAAPSGVGPEPKLTRLKLFNGLRTMTVVCVIFSHTSLTMSFSFVGNPLYIERSGDDIAKQILFNGSLVVSTFFVMSGFLLAFNFELYAEKHRVGWQELPKGVILRWLRLTPAYGLILGLVATVMRRLGTGPLWNQMVTVEADACRQYWWAHVLYINNYVYDDSQCMPQTWYLAADTQLFIAGLMFCIVARTPLAKKVGLAVMALVSILTPALHTYFEDLDGSVIQSPEAVKSIYKTENTFRHVYIAAHTNLAAYTVGIAAGLLAFHWLTEGKDYEKFKKFRYLTWLAFPCGVIVILSGALFYGDERPSLLLRVAYAALYKVVFQICLIFIIMSVIFKVEKVYRGILEWRGFTWAGRVSYSAFLVHTLFLRAFAGSSVTPFMLNDYFVFVILCAAIFFSFAMAVVLWLFVEAPSKELITAALQPKPRVQNTKIIRH